MIPFLNFCSNVSFFFHILNSKVLYQLFVHQNSKLPSTFCSINSYSDFDLFLCQQNAYMIPIIRKNMYTYRQDRHTSSHSHGDNISGSRHSLHHYYTAGHRLLATQSCQFLLGSSQVVLSLQQIIQCYYKFLNCFIIFFTLHGTGSQ